MTEIATIGIKVDSSDVRNAQRDLESLRGGGERATQSFSQLARETVGLGSALKGLAAGLSAMAIYESAKNIVQLADNMTMLESRIKIATKSIADYQAASKALTQISLQTGSSLEANATMFGRLNKAVESMGGSIQTTLGLTKTLSEGLRISGASAGEARSVMIQLSQALSSGVLRGDEFNSIMENGSRVVDALTVATGKTRGELRAMAADGQLTASVVVNALQSQAAAIDKDFANIPLTISAAYENLTTSFQRYVQGVNEANGTTSSLAQSFNALAQNLTPVIEGMLTLGKIAVTVFAAQMTTSVLTYGAAMTQAIAIERAHTAAITMDLERTVAIAAARQAQTASDLAAAQATLAHTTATMSGVAATDARYAATVAVNAATTANIAATGTLTAAQSALTASTVTLGVTMRTLLNPLNLINLGFAALVGWQFGSYLSEQFVQVRVAALSFVGAVLSGFERIKAFAINTGSAIEAIFTGAFNSVKGAIASSASAISGGLNAVGLDGMATKLNSLAAGFKPTTSAFDSFKVSVQATNSAMNANIKAIDDNIVGLVSYELAGKSAKNETLSSNEALKNVGNTHEEAAKKTKKHSEAHKGLSDAAKAAKKDQQELINLISELATPQEKFNTQMAKATEYYNAGKIDLDLYIRALAKYSDELNKSADNGFQAVTAQEKLNESYKKAWELIDGKNGKTVSPEGGAQLLSDAASSYTKEVTPKVSDSSNKALDDYNKKLDDIIGKTNTLGATNSAVFDGALGGISTLAGAFDNLISSIDKNTASYTLLNTEKAKFNTENANMAPFVEAEKYGKLIDTISKQKKADAALESKATNDTLTGIRQVTGATAKMFDEKSSAAKSLHAVEQGIAVAQMAMQGVQAAKTLAGIAVDVAGGVAKMFSQSGWGGFAGAAALLALMGGLGYGAISGMNQPNLSEDRQASNGTGTVLGDDKAKSDSINKSITRLKENSDISMPISQGMLEALISIRDNITNLGVALSKSLGITGMNSADVSKLGYRTALPEIMGSGAMMANLVGVILGTKKSLADSGLSWEPTNEKPQKQTLGELLDGQKLWMQSYNDIKSQLSLFGMLSLGKGSTDRYRYPIDPEIQKIFGDTYKQAATTVNLIADKLGLDKTQTTSRISNYEIAPPDLSLKGLTGDALTKAVDAWWSAEMDKLNASILKGAGIDAFQKVGEGMAETAIRVINGVESASNALDKFGIASIKYEDVINKQGDVGVEIYKQSVDAFEKTSYGFVTGIDHIVQGFDGSLKDLDALYAKLIDIRKLLSYANVNSSNISTYTIQGAGSAEALQKGSEVLSTMGLSKVEQFNNELKTMQGNFDRIGQTMPTSTKVYKELVQSIDTSTEAGQKLQGQLISLAPAVDDLNSLYNDSKTEISGLREQALLMATNVKTGTFTVDTASQTFTSTLYALAAAMGSADRAAQALKVSNTLGFSKNEQVVNTQQTAQAAFDNEASKYGLKGLKFDDAVSASKNVNAGLRSGELKPDGTFEYGGKQYSVAGVLAFNLDYTAPLEAAMNNTISTGQGTGNNRYTSPSGESAKVVDDPSKVLSKATDNSASQAANDYLKTQQDNLKTLSDLQKKVTDDLNNLKLPEFQKSIAAINSSIDDMRKQAQLASGALTGLEELRNEQIKGVFKDVVDEFNNIGKSDYQKSLAGITKWADDMKTVAPDIASAYNITIDQAIAGINAVSKARTDALNKEKEVLLKTMQESYGLLRVDDLVKNVYSSLSGLVDAFKTQIQQLADSDTSITTLAAVVNAAFDTIRYNSQKLVDQLNKDYQTKFDAITAKNRSLNENITLLTKGQSAVDEMKRVQAISDLQSDSYEKQMSAVDTLQSLVMDNYSKQIDAVKTIKNYLSDLALNKTLSPLSKSDQLVESQSQMMSLYAEYQKGNYTVTQDLIKSVNTYLENARSYYDQNNPSEAQLTADKQMVTDLYSRYKAGDTSVAPDLTSSANTLLQNARNYYGTNADYVKIYDEVTNALKGLMGSDANKSTQDLQLDAAKQAVVYLEQISTALTGNKADSETIIGTDSIINKLLAKKVEDVSKVLDGTAEIIAKFAEELNKILKPTGLTVDAAGTTDAMKTYQDMIKTALERFSATIKGAGISESLAGQLQFESAKFAENLEKFVLAGYLKPEDAERIFKGQVSVTTSMLEAFKAGTASEDAIATIWNDNVKFLASVSDGLLAGTISVDTIKVITDYRYMVEQSVIDAVAQGKLSVDAAGKFYTDLQTLFGTLAGDIKNGSVDLNWSSLVGSASTLLNAINTAIANATKAITDTKPPTGTGTEPPAPTGTGTTPTGTGTGATTGTGTGTSTGTGTGISVFDANYFEGIRAKGPDYWWEAALYAKSKGLSKDSLSRYIDSTAGDYQQTWDWLTMMGYANGGLYPGGLALVGEQGPEIINFGNPGQVYTAPQTRELLSGDNSEVVAELRATVQELRTQNQHLIVMINDLRNGFDQNNKDNRRQAESLETIERKTSMVS